MERVFDAKLTRNQIVQNTRDTVQHVINGQINQPFNSSSYKQPIALGHLRLKDVSQERLQEFADALSQRKKKNGEPLSPEYISRVFDYIRIAWRLMRRDRLLRRYAGQLSFDAEDLQLPKARLQVRPNRAYSGVEVEQLINCCKDAYETAIIGLGLLGVRMPGEGRAVQWTDFHEIDGKRFLVVGRQVVNEGKSRSVRHRKSTEGAERVTLWVPERLWQMIVAVKPISEELGCDYVLATSHKGEAGPMSAKTIQTKFESVKKRAGIVREGATMYALRHTAVSFTMEVGGEEAARLIGAWSTPKVLREHYDQSRATVILPRAGEQLPWAVGEVPKVPLPKLRRG
jgi:integrase